MLNNEFVPIECCDNHNINNDRNNVMTPNSIHIRNTKRPLNMRIIKSLINNKIDELNTFYINYQSDINFIDLDGNTIIHHTIIFLKYDVLNILLKFKPDLNIKNINGDTPLHLLFINMENNILNNRTPYFGKSDIIKMIEYINISKSIMTNENINISNKNGLKPIDYLYKINKFYIDNESFLIILIKMLEWNTITILLNIGYNYINHQDNYGNTALHYLCIIANHRFFDNNPINLLLYFLKYNVNDNILNNENKIASNYLIQ